VLRLLNDGLRTGRDPIYAESMAADVFDESQRELVLSGPKYYGQSESGRRNVGRRPRASSFLPVGGNFCVMHAFAAYVSVYNDTRVRDALRRAAPRLLAEGFEADGGARRTLGAPGRGNLRDQGDAGLGLLAVHGLTGTPESLHAAEGLASSLLRHFETSSHDAFRNVADDADVPAVVREAAPDPAWNGRALRFLAELAAMTRDPRWVEPVRRHLAAWSHHAPASGHGLGDLGHAAFRLETPPPVVLITATPGSAEGEKLLSLALPVVDPSARFRWVASDEAKEIGRRFGVRIETAPALYLVWGNPSAALRDEDALRAVWNAAAQGAMRGE
jgi:uncharacterized protein YyaL (SSP411 family)